MALMPKQQKKKELIDLNKYKDFVEKVTSIQSNETGSLTEQLNKLEHESNVNMALLLTGSIGIALRR